MLLVVGHSNLHCNGHRLRFSLLETLAVGVVLGMTDRPGTLVQVGAEESCSWALSKEFRDLPMDLEKEVQVGKSQRSELQSTALERGQGRQS